MGGFSRGLAVAGLCSVLFASKGFTKYGPQSCFEHSQPRDGFAWDERRGSPAEFDPGPFQPESESWLKLYGSLPNYRSLGRLILGGTDEKFRWQMGPMWYRGRLGQNQVKVFVVGQEGAQDENVTNRAFTGSTGTRLQKFLNHLGIYRSYLFMNTFIYTIYGQRIEAVDRTTGEEVPEFPAYMQMEQGESSPIVRYRHQLFDNVILQNPDSIALFVAVGSGGKESLATWINSRSPQPKCKAWALERCDLSGVVQHFAAQGVLSEDKKLLAIGVVHPGGAAFGNAGDNIRRSFDGASQDVANFLANHPGWLPEDPEEGQFAQCNGGERLQRLQKSFRYGHAPIPFRDFSFATNWRMGDVGTTSNRDGADKVRIFSENGEYAVVDIPSSPRGPCKLIRGKGCVPSELQTEEDKQTDGRTVFNDRPPIFDDYEFPPQASSQLYDPARGLLTGMKTYEVPNEPPRYSPYGEAGDLNHVQQFDPGPASPELAEALMAWPDFNELDTKAFYNDPSFGFGPSYRGNTRDPKYIILADQMGHTDLFSTRALTGAGGQFLQSFLKATGLEAERSYLILRSLPIDTLGKPLAARQALFQEEDSKGRSALKTLAASLKLVANQNQVQILVMGELIQSQLPALGKIPGLDELISRAQILTPPTPQGDHIQNWQTVALELQRPAPGVEELSVMSLIPRWDLPYSTRWWMGSSGESGDRAYGESEYHRDSQGNPFDYTGHYYRVRAPRWIWNLNQADPRPLTLREQQEAEATLEAIAKMKESQAQD